MREPWPPLPSPTSRYTVKAVRVADVEPLHTPGAPPRPIFEGQRRRSTAMRLRLREVPLWGRRVSVDDETGRVWCHGCHRLVDVDELASVTNGHPVGIVRDLTGALLPMSDEDGGPDAA